MAQVNTQPGVPNWNLLATVASNDYDGIPEGVLNTRENQPAVAAGATTALGRPVDPGMPQNFP